MKGQLGAISTLNQVLLIIDLSHHDMQLIIIIFVVCTFQNDLVLFALFGNFCASSIARRSCGSLSS